MTQHTPTSEVALAAHEFALADALLKADYAPWKIEEIIRAVNSHGALLSIVKRLRESCDDPGCADCLEADEAITKAEGKS